MSSQQSRLPLSSRETISPFLEPVKHANDPTNPRQGREYDAPPLIGADLDRIRALLFPELTGVGYRGMRGDQ